MNSLRSLLCLALCVLASAAIVVALAGCGGGGSSSFGAIRDTDGDGIPDDQDNDLDGDGRLNQYDRDVDGDGLANWRDSDIDGDGTLNAADPTPYGPWLPAGQTLFVTQGVATVSFGDVPAGHEAGPAVITIQNDTVSSVAVRRVELAGTGAGAYRIDTSTLGSIPFVLGPGASRSFRAWYRPQAGVPALGRVEVDLQFGDTGVFLGVVHLLGQGNSPALLTSGAPSTMNFGDVPVGVVGGPGVATVRNDTSATWTLTDVRLTGTGGGTFEVDLAPLEAALPVAIPPGDQVSFHVTFTPRQGVPSLGELFVDLDSGAAQRSIALDLLGQGVAPSMTIVPSPAAFGAVLAGVEAATVEVRIRNEWYASGTLTLTGVSLLDDGGGAYTLDAVPPLPASIPPGGAPVTVRVRFAPAAGAFGPIEGRLRIEGNDPLIAVDHALVLEGDGAGWQRPLPEMPGDLQVAGPGFAPLPAHLAGSTRYVLRHAGSDGIFGGLVAPDDEIVVIDADPDGDPETPDARIVVRWGGLALSPAASCAPVDAGTGRHVFFVSPGLDSTLGTGDDTIHVLDTVSGLLRTLSCPSAGQHKSRPVVVDPDLSLVVVATGVGGGVLPSADTLLVYRNLLGNLNALAPDQSVALGVVVPDVHAALPVPVGRRAVVMPCADASDEPDFSDRALDDGNEGVVQVRNLLTGAQVSRLALERALARTPVPAPGDGFCRPVALSDTTVLVPTAGLDPLDPGDDEIVRVEGVGDPALVLGAARLAPGLDGLASRPVALGDGFYAFASTGADGVYGTADDALMRLDPAGAMALQGFGPGEPLAGQGGAGALLLPVGGGVVVATTGADHAVGTGDDRLLVLDPASAGPGSVRGALPVPGGLFDGGRTTPRSLAGPTAISPRFLAVLDRGPDGMEGTADDRLRVFRDKDGDGRFGTAADDLDLDGAFGAADAFDIPLPLADGARSPLAASPAGHLLLVEAGPGGVLGQHADDRPVLWWLRGAALLP